MDSDAHLQAPGHLLHYPLAKLFDFQQALGRLSAARGRHLHEGALANQQADDLAFEPLVSRHALPRGQVIQTTPSLLPDGPVQIAGAERQPELTIIDLQHSGIYLRALPQPLHGHAIPNLLVPHQAVHLRPRVHKGPEAGVRQDHSLQGVPHLQLRQPRLLPLRGAGRQAPPGAGGACPSEGRQLQPCSPASSQGQTCQKPASTPCGPRPRGSGWRHGCRLLPAA
mmetsp:Transcript_128838/g.313102  ORF Transcript_128838/g.313102 Transcript_128838/m.313102 type:complete len:225 (+) Transcript_128838:181-855(+)